MNVLSRIFGRKVTENFRDIGFEEAGLALKKEIDAAFGRSLAIRELDSGSDNAAEIELVNINAPHYDVERFGISFVASPRHADALIITGAVTRNMKIAVEKTYEAMPSPKLVTPAGDEAWTGGKHGGSHAVLGGADRVLPVDMKIPGNPPYPAEILRGLL